MDRLKLWLRNLRHFFRFVVEALGIPGRYSKPLEQLCFVFFVCFFQRSFKETETVLASTFVIFPFCLKPPRPHDSF